MQKILLIVSLLFLSDYTAIKLSKKLNPSINIIQNPNVRWFFIHFVSNLFVTINSIPDLIQIIKDPFYSLNNKWNVYSYNTFYISVITHLYHIIFFNLTKADRLHHFLMVLIAGSIEYYKKSIISPAALFFITGLPGCIDYFLLFLVKLNKIQKKTEKIIYLYLSAYLRCPGACVISVIGLYNIKNEFYISNFNGLISLLSCILVFWNGHYYLMTSSIDYGKFIEKNKI